MGENALKIAHLTPGAGGMYCGGCFRDNALVAALRRLGHDVLMVPLYLPLNLEEPDQSADTPIFFSGVNVYLQQRSSFFGRLPRWLNRLLASPMLLRRAGKAAAKTRPEEVGEITLSMLRGEEGKQARELSELIHWLKTRERPGVVCLSNVLLAGLARRLKAELDVPVVCTFQGEDGFLDAMHPAYRADCWELLRDRARDIDLFIAPSGYCAHLMSERLALPHPRVQVVYNGIRLDGYSPAPAPPKPPVLGYFARMCPEKGLEAVVEAFLILKQRGRVPLLRLRIGGSLGPSDMAFVAALQERLRRNGALKDAEFCPNLSREDKQAFYRSLSLLSVPAPGEAFGLYVIEALASGVPVVLPARGAFPELVRTTGGGLLYDPPTGNELARAVESLLLDENTRCEMALKGRQAAAARFGIERMALEMVDAYRSLTATGR